MNTTVLIVDDDRWFADQHARVVAAAGYAPVIVHDVVAALDAIDAQPPAAIILDMFLPAANAMVLLHELASHADLAAIPIIVCSTSGADLAALQTGYGVACVLDKTTMRPADVVAALRRALL